MEAENVQIKLEKISELPNAKHQNNIEVGHIETGWFMNEPVVGEAFWVGFGWRTSRVTEIIDENTFKTENSTYHWSVIEN